MTVKQDWAKYANDYDIYTSLPFAEEIVKYCELPAAPTRVRLLDVACGTGAVEYVLGNHTHVQVMATDFDKSMVDAAGKLIADHKWTHMRARVVDAQNMSTLLSGTFDRVTSQFGVAAFENPEAGLREIYRVLRSDGGRLVMSSWADQTHFVELARRTRKAGTPTPVTPQLRWGNDLGYADDQCRAVGFSNVHSYSITKRTMIPDVEQFLNRIQTNAHLKVFLGQRNRQQRARWLQSFRDILQENTVDGQTFLDWKAIITVATK
ncbi:hypothetical protein RI367_007022 [Sorochytrium milnesiophthora]